MKLGLRVLVVLLGLTWGTASAQDARSIVQAAATKLGATNVKTVQFSGAGWIAAVGQSYSLTDEWPKFEMPAYTKVIDYDARTSREEYTRRQGSYPPRGGGFTPLQGEPRTVALLSGAYAWNMDGTTVVPQPGKDPFLGGITVSDLRQLEIFITPHGFLKAALASPSLNAITQTYAGPSSTGPADGRKATVVSITVMGKYRVNGTINDQSEVEMVATWVPTPFYGDTIHEWGFRNYKDFGGIRFPTLIHVHTGHVAFNPGHNSLHINVTDVKANVAVPPMPVPDTVRTATVPPVRVTTQKLAEGVWFLAGGSHNSVAVEFKDFVTVIEAPQDEERSLAVIDAVNTLVPNKELRWAVNTHHHFDHSGGLRTYVSQGAMVVATPANLEFYRNVMFLPVPRTLQPDRMATFAAMDTGGREPMLMEPVHQRYVISDGVRTLELHPVAGNPHAVGMLMAYLPTEKILVHADLYSPPAPNATAPKPNPAMTSLLNNIRRLKLDVAQHVPIHGAPGTHENFLKLFAGGTQ